MKTILFYLSLLIVPFTFAQTQIENPGFEGSWENVTGSEDEPSQWSSLKTADALTTFAPIVLFKSNDSHSGSYSARLKNKTTAGIVANGIMTNGRVHASFDPDEGYVFTESSNPDWNTPFTGRPDSLVAWYKYAPAGGDKGKIEILLHAGSTAKLPEVGSTAHWVGKARYNITNSSGSWRRLSTPFHYYNGATPSYALVVVSSGDSTIAVNGSELFIDDIELIYNPADVSLTTNGNLKSVIINKSQTGLDVEFPSDLSNNAELSLFSLDGKLTYTSIITSKTSHHTLSEKGIFIYQIIENDRIYKGKISL